MRVPISWLREYVDPGLSAAEIGDRLTMTGTKLEALHHHGVGDTSAFVVGRVLSAEQHPDADRLRVCMVDVGDAEPSQIVCGAPNVAAGQVVGVALPGAVMPDGTRLKKAKLRGVESAGMILAEDELAIGSDHQGIMELTSELPSGTPLEAVLPIATEVLELEITPNRPDCLSVYGVAREVHAATGADLAPPPWLDDQHPAGEGIDGVQITVACPDLCPRFTARAFENVEIGPSPLWLKARLSAAGQRPIFNVVDITNYVMLLTGQPLHAFDLDRVAGGRLNIRRAADGERVETLDGQVRVLDEQMIVIEDADGPTSIAGVMGGARSEVGPETTRVLMEVATWDGPTINRTSWRLGLRSEASARNEKLLSPRQAMDAQAVAARLMVELCGAAPLGGTIDVGGPGPDPAPVGLRVERTGALIGVPVAAERQRELLVAVGCEMAQDGATLTATPPYWRGDLTREADLIEEVARLDGVDRLPATLHAPFAAGGLSATQRAKRRAEDVLVGCGLHEIAGWSFTEPAFLERARLPADTPVVRLENPMSERESIMRPEVLGSLLDAAAHNLARGHTELGLFESGHAYRPGAGPLPDETHQLVALLVGADATALAVKGLLEAVLDTLRVPWSAERTETPTLHPAKAGAVVVGKERVATFGELHPLVARAWDIEAPAAAFTLDLGRVAELAPQDTTFRDLTSFPALRQDIAVVVADEVPAGRVVAVVREAGGRLLEAVRVFDRYPLGDDRVSLALHLEFRAPDRTLTDEDVAPVRESIVAALRDELGGELRA
ncbi:MAG: phenylalanyl-tRNA synthetase beta chain [Solirubrobacteraceae bacterium]|nr:phenylalanyl-tRNA synthetase beta chain [Solirubrobacteraceae bacterium]